MLASVTGISVNVLAVVTSPTVTVVAPPPPAPPSVVESPSTNVSLIIAIVVGVILAIVVVGAGVFVYRRNEVQKRLRSSKPTPAHMKKIKQGPVVV
jgi:H+/gluconate symporter-like permease